MIRAELQIPDDRFRGNRSWLEQSGVLPALEAAMFRLNPDWRDHHPQTAVVQSVRSRYVLVMITADCRSVGDQLDRVERLELE